MAKKADLLAEAKDLGLKVTEKNTIAEIEAAIKEHSSKSAETEKIAEETNKDVVSERTATVAKAGKRSQKALDEAEAKAEKEARKEAGDTSSQDSEVETQTQKGPVPITRPRLERRGKNYQEAAKLIDKTKTYSLNEAIDLAQKSSKVKFDASVEVHARLGVDPRQADQNIRATVSLPHGTGKTIRVAVFAPEDQHAAAKTAGADIIGEDDFLKQLDKEITEFDVLVATPTLMPKLGKYARLLGPRGLMPSPKAGTVAADVAKAVKDAKTGKIEYRVDKQSVVHVAIGKVSFKTEHLIQNAEAFLASLKAQKPSTLKGSYVRSLYVTTSMGPSVKLENSVN